MVEPGHKYSRPSFLPSLNLNEHLESVFHLRIRFGVDSPTPALFTEYSVFVKFIEVSVQVIQDVLLDVHGFDTVCLHLVDALDRVFYRRFNLHDDFQRVS